MTMHASTIDSIRKSLVGLRMPRALEALDATLRRASRARSTASRPSTNFWWKN